MKNLENNRSNIKMALKHAWESKEIKVSAGGAIVILLSALALELGHASDAIELAAIGGLLIGAATLVGGIFEYIDKVKSCG